MNKVTDDAVREFVKKELPLVTTLLLRKVDLGDDDPIQALHESDDMAEMAQKYFDYFNVQPDGFSLNNYYPWRIESSIRKLWNNNPVNQNKKPLTIRMFAESAKAGRWLYG